ncbi:MAG: hypothetical protein J5871_01845 [Bacteroidales bacterium]|nr:hypothetical protein [Bacteroidales bacterium]
MADYRSPDTEVAELLPSGILAGSFSDGGEIIAPASLYDDDWEDVR